jgi:hypothetical protein
MKLGGVLLMGAGIAVASTDAGAADAVAKTLQLRSKSAIESTLGPSYRGGSYPASSGNPQPNAPFVMPADEPDLNLFPARDERQEQSRSSCAGERSLCYDPSSGRIVYKPSRALMPDIPGLQRENISVKRDRVVLRYSF